MGKITKILSGIALLSFFTFIGCGDDKDDDEIKPIEVLSVVLDKTALTLEESESATLIATINPDDAEDKTLTWESNNPASVIVDNNGKVVAVREGSSVITAMSVNDIKATCAVTVTKKIVPVAGVSLDKTSLELEIGGKDTLKAAVTPADAANQSVQWSSDNTSVATVNEEGEVIAVQDGTATITVTTDDGGKTATCEVTVLYESKEIPFTDLIPDRYWSQWYYRGAEDKEPIIINSRSELVGDIEDIKIDFSEVDYSKYTLLIVRGHTQRGIHALNKQLIQTATSEYTLNIDIDILNTMAPDSWVVGIVVPKISQDAVVLLNVNKHYSY